MDNKELQRAAKTVSFRDQKLTVYEILSMFRQAEKEGKTSFTYKEIKYALNQFLQSKSEALR
ncbi:MAG: hypothetical protein U0N00_05830 [Oscillospiraceae bacterium]